MKQLNPSQTTILQVLGDGLCHSGTELGEILKVSRSAVWKQINQLMAMNIPIIRLANQGYKLPEKLVLLDENIIQQLLSTKGFKQAYTLHLLTTIDSTNHYLRDRSGEIVDICCAEVQTQGKGRFGRHWHSPFGENIYCSSRWRFNCDLSTLSGLSLVTSLAVLATIKQINPEPLVQVKWPNDLLWQNRKLSGNLIEISAETNGIAQVIIGIGLNVNSNTAAHPLADKPWCSLFDVFGFTLDRNQLIADLLINLERYLHQFIKNGLSDFVEEWNQNDYLRNKSIKISQPASTLSGTARGIDQTGHLILEDETGIQHFLSSGDTSLA